MLFFLPVVPESKKKVYTFISGTITSVTATVSVEERGAERRRAAGMRAQHK